MFGYLLAQVIKREDVRFMSIIEFIAGGLGIGYIFFFRCFLSDDYAEILSSSIWASWAESDNRGMRWLFQDDYGKALFRLFESMCSFPDACLYHVDVIQPYRCGSLTHCSRSANSVQNTWKPIIHDVTATWWWIAYRIVASAVITTRHRNDEEMKLRFRILTFGLIVEGSALCTFLAIPIFRCDSSKNTMARERVVLPPRYQHRNVRILGHGTDYRIYWKTAQYLFSMHG